MTERLIRSTVVPHLPHLVVSFDINIRGVQNGLSDASEYHPI